jgi:pimeloyl-ACP methyl ester carboxylesterase
MDDGQAMLRMSDGSYVRVWRVQHFGPTSPTTVMILGGWGGALSPRDPLARALESDFDLLLVETREKSSSALAPGSRHDLDRLAQDLSEICAQLCIDPSRLVVYAYSWSSILVAQAVVRYGWRPRRVVLGCPIAKLTMPPLTRHLLGLVPAGALSWLKPAAGWWVSRFRARDPADASTALAVLAAADLVKWRAVGRHVVAKSYWSLYAALDVPVIAVRAVNERFHDPGEHRRIVGLIPSCRSIELPIGTEAYPRHVAAIIRAEANAISSATLEDPPIGCGGDRVQDAER